MGGFCPSPKSLIRIELNGNTSLSTKQKDKGNRSPFKAFENIYLAAGKYLSISSIVFCEIIVPM